VLLVALVGLGAGPELGVVEFARVFFVTRVLSSLVPTPGGVGVVEAGLTGALVAAGVPVAPAVGAVLVYRLATFLVPIVTGTACWLLWSRVDGRTRDRGAGDPRTAIARCAGGGSNMLADVTEGRDHAAWTHPHVDPQPAQGTARAVAEEG
jgi:predicted MFS family arabinose efflux permease